MPRWARIGRASPFGPTGDSNEDVVGWTWEIRRESDERRLVRVEVTHVPFLVTDLPAVSRNAIRSRGATAVDAYLHQDVPPERLLISTNGVHPRDGLATESPD
jgi:hypothetical protein